MPRPDVNKDNDIYLMVVADDLGLTPEINAGILAAYERGIVRSASLLVNGRATNEAIEICRRNPGLEIGLHLSVVEGYSLLNQRNSITDTYDYFPDGPCLHRNWQRFAKLSLAGKINLAELKLELELQIKKFLDYFPAIPFLNTTQHLHLFPGVDQIVIDLVEKYKIPAVRCPSRIPPGASKISSRTGLLWVTLVLGKLFRRKLGRAAVLTPDYFLGFEHSGHLVENRLLAHLRGLRPGFTELMSHPGSECKFLRNAIPGYADFDWEGELAALTSVAAKQALVDFKIKLSTYGELANFAKHNLKA